MADWQRKINLSAAHRDFKAGLITVQQLAAVVHRKLTFVRPLKIDSIDAELEDLIKRFSSLAEDESATIDDYDDALSALYDWGDISIDGKWNGKKVCWVNTMSA